MKTFDGFCRRWVEFCEDRGYDMLDTNAKTGEEFLQAERNRHKNPGDNVVKALNQSKKLCRIRGCPNFSEAEQTYMQAVVTQAKRDSTLAERCRPVDENKRQMDRNIITAAELQKLLRFALTCLIV